MALQKIGSIDLFVKEDGFPLTKIYLLLIGPTSMVHLSTGLPVPPSAHFVDVVSVALVRRLRYLKNLPDQKHSRWAPVM